MGLRRAIEASIASLIANGHPIWLVSDVVEYNALPLYVDFQWVFAITPELELVRWLSDELPRQFGPLTNPYQRRFALKYGSRNYPYLEPLCANRPANAADCLVCKGTGTFPNTPDHPCVCGGYGWMIPGEHHGDYSV